jgi:hypothetical protein
MSKSLRDDRQRTRKGWPQPVRLFLEELEGRCLLSLSLNLNGGIVAAGDGSIWANDFGGILAVLTGSIRQRDSSSNSICLRLSLVWKESPWERTTPFGSRRGIRLVALIQLRELTRSSGEGRMMSFPDQTARFGLRERAGWKRTGLGELILQLWGKKKSMPMGFHWIVDNFLDQVWQSVLMEAFGF